VTGSLPLEAILQHEHAVGLALPDPDQPGPGLHARTNRRPIEAALARRRCDLAQDALRRRREPAEGFDLELIGNRTDEEVAPERGRGGIAVEGRPTLAEDGEAEARQAVDLGLDLTGAEACHRLTAVLRAAAA
jgi:hypothetical protein